MSEPVTINNCPICGKDENPILMEKEGYRYSRCAQCDHVYSSLRPSDEELAEILNEWGKCHHGNTTRAEWEVKHGFARAAFWPRSKLIEQFRLNNTVLDLGCSTGGFLLYMRSEERRVG